MSIEEANVVDIISSERDGTSVTLTATDHLEWGDREHLILIQEKLNSYLSFVESGEIFESYPKARTQVIKLEVVCRYPPDTEGRKFLELCGEAIAKAGFEFSFRVHEI